MKWSHEVMSESFYLSNMSPQDPSFNRGIWKKLESYVRTWADENDEIYVLTGPVLTGTYQTIGPNNVAVPDSFYKVILDIKEPEIKGIGFVLENKSSQSTIETFAVSINETELLTGIDFFSSLPDALEEQIESVFNISKWTFSEYTNNSDSNTPIDDNSSSKVIVYITETGSKYHREGCRYLSQSKIPISLEDAKAQGYTPCSVCNPPN